MADLHPSPFCDLVKRMFLEPERQQTIFDLPFNKMYVPDPALDTSVKFHGKVAATPVGPAAGPQTQMAQNILLSWLGGSRILELKTVQINDHLVINRLYDAADADEKRAVGTVCASRSNGKCLFVMPTEGDFSVITKAMK